MGVPNTYLGNTPDGLVPTFPKHIPFVTIDDFVKHPLGQTISVEDDIYTNGTLAKICDAGCELLENMCGRYFIYQAGVTFLKKNVNIRRSVEVKLVVPGTPIHAVNSIYLQYLNSFQPLQFDYLTTDEQVGTLMFYPELTLGTTIAPIPETLLSRGKSNAWVNYDFGYALPGKKVITKTGNTAPNIDNTLCQAAIILAAKFIALQNNPANATNIHTGDLEMSWRRSAGQKDEYTEFVEEIVKSYKNQFFFVSSGS